MNSENIIELMPMYLIGRLDSNQRHQVETAIKANEDLQRELEFLHILENRIKSEHIVSPGEMGWARLKRDIVAIDNNSQAKQATHSKSNSSAWWKTAAIAASLAMVIQSAVLIQQQSKPIDSYRPLSSSELKHTVKVKFAANASEIQLRRLLVKLQGQIVDGPSALGIYHLRFQNQQSALISLNDSALVEYAEAANE